jgi:hypothetical protein
MRAFDKLLNAHRYAPASTYLHAGVRHGWPHDQKCEDTFEVPPMAVNPGSVLNVQLNQTTTCAAPEYKAEYGADGSARLYLHAPKRLIGTFDTFADAQLAAEALNNHKGY